MIVKGLRLIGLAAVAGLCGMSGAFMHRWVNPVGLVLAVGAVAAVCVLARRWSRTRVGIAIVGAAWLLPVVVLAQNSAGGDVVIAADALGLVFLFGGASSAAVMIGMGAESGNSAQIT